MDLDLTKMLADWPYEAGKINVRLIQAENGEPLIQVRLDLGLLQMHAEGRPDGETPHGYGSILEYLEAKRDGTSFGTLLDEDEEHAAGGTDMPAEGDEAFEINSDEARQLREEAVQYYHRYIAMLVLDDYEAVVRDTARNLRALDFCRDHATEDEDRDGLEQFRPYILMMRSRALASLMIRQDEPKAALLAVDEGLSALKACFEERGEPEAFASSQEAKMLTSMRDALLPKLPVSQSAELRERLSKAIAAENYELAAILRDELASLGD
ncbi:MAG: UvrB/UvrC motif-containing protein [Planctomycetota bacterium]